LSTSWVYMGLHGLGSISATQGLGCLTSSRALSQAMAACAGLWPKAWCFGASMLGPLGLQAAWFAGWLVEGLLEGWMEVVEITAVT
jgi:hypothetical protein